MNGNRGELCTVVNTVFGELSNSFIVNFCKVTDPIREPTERIMSKERPVSAQSRTAWAGDMDYGSGGARPDNNFEFGPRDEADLPSAMENEYGQKPARGERPKDQTQVAQPKSTGFCGKIGRGIRCE